LQLFWRISAEETVRSRVMREYFHPHGCLLICRATLSLHFAAKKQCISWAQYFKKGEVMKEVAVVKKIATLLFLLASLAVLPAAQADEWNQATKFTFSQPVQIPGRVLPAGTYMFELLNGFNHEIVRISNEDRTKVVALIPAIPCRQHDLLGKSAVILAQRRESQPEAVIAWTYPGRLDGHQFLYPRQVQSELSKSKHDTFVVGD
jgi:hypothetical protein